MSQKINRSLPLDTIKKLINDRYKGAKAVFWAGSVSKNKGTKASDLDLIIFFESIPNAYREAFIYDSWPIDAFIHDIETVLYFLKDEREGNGISALSTMILQGIEITEPDNFSKQIKIFAQEALRLGPSLWNQEQIDKGRFFITDALEDIKFTDSKEEQMASACRLFESLGQFYFRAQNKWSASGKDLVPYLHKENRDFASEFAKAFEQIFTTGNVIFLEQLVKKILEPYGGLLWDGFKQEAPKTFKIKNDT